MRAEIKAYKFVVPIKRVAIIAGNTTKGLMRKQ
jgi:hypothetical protein